MMAMVDQRHAAVEHGGEVEWVRSRCEQADVGVRSWCEQADARVRSQWCGMIWVEGAAVGVARSRLALAW